MSSDIETFLCMVQYTKYMTNLLFESKESANKYIEEIEILFGEENFKHIKEIVELNNKHINSAIKELLKNQKQIDELIEETNITKEEIEEIAKYLE